MDHVGLSCVPSFGEDASAKRGPGCDPWRRFAVAGAALLARRFDTVGPAPASARPNTLALEARVRRVRLSRRNRLAQRTSRRAGAPRTPPRDRRRSRAGDNEGIIPVLAQAVREVEAAAQRGRSGRRRARSSRSSPCWSARSAPGSRPTPRVTEAERAEQLKRLDGIATILAKTAARDTSLLALLAEDAAVSAVGGELKREMLGRPGASPSRRTEPEPDGAARLAAPTRRVVPQSVVARQLANPFLAPDFSAGRDRPPDHRRLGELGAARPRCSAPSSTAAAPRVHAAARARRRRCTASAGCELMPHQAQVVAAAAAGHRTFLLADEPGLGKTAQALLAAEAADAFPLLVVVPNVVKTNWAREAELWTPRRPGHGDPRRRRRPSTASPTSSSSTTRSSTATSAGWATSASAAWSSTRRTSSRTSSRSARSTCCELSERIRARSARRC